MAGRRRFIWLTMVAAVLIMAGVLTWLNQQSPRLFPVEGIYRVAGGELEDTLYLLDTPVDRGSTLFTYPVHLEEAEGYSLYLPDARGRQVFLDGVLQEPLPQSEHLILPLTGEESGEYLLQVAFPRVSVTGGNSCNVLVGTTGRVVAMSRFSTVWRLFIVGIFFAIILYSLSLFYFKPTEKYLLILAVFAYISGGRTFLNAFPALGGNPVLNLLLSATPYIPALTATQNSMLSRHLLTNLLNPLLRSLLFREFVDTKVGCRSYYWFIFLPAGACLLSLGLPDLFTVLMYLMFWYVLVWECYIIVRSKSGGRPGSNIFILAWVFTAACQLVNDGCQWNLLPHGTVNIHFRLSGFMILFYTLGYVFNINGKFAGKFAEAERLSRSLAAVNNNLEGLVSERTGELELAYDRLFQVQRQKREFFNSMLHNVKTPLFTALGYNDMLLSRLETQNPELLPQAGKIGQSIRYVQKLLGDLFLTMRLEDRTVAFHKTRFDLDQLLGQIRDALEVNSGNKATVTYQCDTRDCFAVGDAFYLQQALQNIGDNALEQGCEHLALHITLSREEDVCLITIRDNGPGINPEDLPSIFDRYFSKHKQGSGGKSSGLGLTIAREIIGHHGGSIQVESAPGMGACFTIRLPGDAQELMG